ncbi:recombinase family protein [Flectobacillus roseus]|uniref:recombinase family protein n=1 Tax=Flectobacillus roseus TaxID=502259 RepID=UPI0024B86AE9|nr:recombinase family protein [Flectobacillus roseus]MDI9872680.1 recombinase family protein [Flectobacillus roseus]
MNNKYVAYMRVSTQKQKNSGLGLEGQKGIIQFFTSMNKAEIVQEFVEAESGKETNRPILREAVELCKDNQYTLIVAKIDRLSRNVPDTFLIVQELENRVIACDIPIQPIDSLTLAIYSGLAQRERELISIRTKLALKAKRDRGEVIVRKASPNFPEVTKKGQAAWLEYTKDFYTNEVLVLFVERFVKQQLSYSEIADRLNKKGFVTRRNMKYNKLSVLRLIRNVKKYYLAK